MSTGIKSSAAGIRFDAICNKFIIQVMHLLTFLLINIQFKFYAPALTSRRIAPSLWVFCTPKCMQSVAVQMATVPLSSILLEFAKLHAMD